MNERQRLIAILILTLLAAQWLRAGGGPETAERVRYKDGPAYIYRVYLSDKNDSPYSLSHPSRFLSRRSVERRRRQQLALDSTDLPVNPAYVRQIRGQGLSVEGCSRWQNTVLVRTRDTTALRRLQELPFVRGSKLVWQSPDSVEITERRVRYHDRFEDRDTVSGQPYGKAYEQISVMQGQRLHDIGMTGEGMMIAVIDGGFKNVDRIPAFTAIDICGTRDFVSPGTFDMFSDTDHGSKVLSTMGMWVPYYYIGTAPKSSYWLLRSEDRLTEQEVEEDYWTMAAEYADSVGCDIINSSLGYNEYDYPEMTHHLWQLDGRTAFASRSASLMAGKGMVVVSSAGNSGMGPWKKIGVPADADDILTVGAVTGEKPNRIAPFSSIGPSQDGRVKPDVVAVGAPAFIVNGRGLIMEDMGTSFAAPIVCGLAACLWQALPQLKAAELIQLIRETGSNNSHPDNIYGHGIPNFWKAYMIGTLRSKEVTGVRQ